MLDRGGVNSLIRLIHTIVNEKFLHFSRGVGGTGAPPIPPEVLKDHALDPDAGPHTGTLPEDEVGFDDAAGHDHQGAGDTGKKVDVKDLTDTDGQLLTGVQKTDLTDGGATVLHAHAAGITDAVQIILTNETGGERTAGDVVVTDPDNDESFIGTSGSGYQGKVLVVAETIATSGSGPCWERGGPFEIDVVGAVDRNDGLRTSATIYKAEAAPSVVSDGVFAIALSSSGSGGGTIKAVFLDVVSAGGGDGDGGDHYVTELIHWYYTPGGVEGNVGNIGIVTLGNTDYAVFNWHLPSDFDSIIKAVMVILPDATEQVQYDTRSSYAAIGETWGTPSESQDNLTKNVVLNQLDELDVSGVLTGVAAGDYGGISIVSDIDSLRVMGFLLRCKTT